MQKNMPKNMQNMQVFMILLNIACNMQNMQNNMHDMQNMQTSFPICRICTAHFADARKIEFVLVFIFRVEHSGSARAAYTASRSMRLA
jgi:hypothetical protein